MKPLLAPDLLRCLEQFQLLSARRAKSSARGERRSHARGQSVEFADYRSYTAGDDFRHLDWNLYGRLEKLFLKLYEEERELPVRIFLDCSESMNFGAPRKFDFARQLAAAIGYVALCGFDRVSVVAFPEPPFPDAESAARGALRAVRGRNSAMIYFQNLSKFQTRGAANLNDALRRGAIESRQPGAAIVLSDFLDPAGYEPGLNALISRGFQVSAIQILAPEELNPGQFGDLRFIDSETGATQEVTFGKYRLKHYQQTVGNFCGQLAAFCKARGVNYFQTASDASLRELLLKELRAAKVWS